MLAADHKSANCDHDTLATPKCICSMALCVLWISDQLGKPGPIASSRSATAVVVLPKCEVWPSDGLIHVQAGLRWLW